MDVQDSKRNDWKWLCGLEALALALRLRGISSALDGDEVFSVRAALGSWSHTIHIALNDRSHPPLHLILLHLWTQVFGASSVSVRALSVLASVVFLAALWLIARRFASRSVAVIATAVCAVSPYFVYYGQQARPYSLIACFALLSVLALLRWTERPESGSRALVYVVLCLCLMLSQYVGLVFVATEWLALALAYRFSIRALAPSAVAVVPSILWFILGRAANDLPMGTFIGWIARPRMADLPTTIIELCGWPPFPHGGAILLLAIVIALAGVLIAAFAVADERRILLTSTALALSVPSALFVLSWVAPNSYWAPRQMIGSAAMFSVVIAAGLARCTPVLRSCASIVLLGCVGFASWLTPPEAQRPAWDRVAETATEQCRDCRVVAFEPWVSNPLSYYLGRPVDVVGAVPSTNQRMVLVCRDLKCPVEKDPGEFRHVAQYEAGDTSSRVQLFIAGKSE